MLGIEPRALRATWTVFLVLLTLFLFYLARRAILLFIISVFFAYLLSPLVDFVERYNPARLSRTLSLAVVYIALVGVLVAFGALMFGRIVEEAANLSVRLPDPASGSTWLIDLPLPAWIVPLRDRLLAALKQEMAASAERSLPMLKSAVGGLMSGIGTIVLAVLVPIFSFFLLKDGRALRDGLLDYLPPERRDVAMGLFGDIHLLLGQYIRALLLLGLASFIVCEAFFEATRVPYSVLLAAFAGLMELIPVFGPLTAALVTITTALVTGYAHVGWLVVFFIALRMVQDYVLQPHLLSAGVELHPVLVLFGAVAGEQIAGVPGMLLSAPVMATLRVIYVRLRKSRVHSTVTT